MTNLESFEKAIENVGGQRALARICNTSQPRVWNWLNRDKIVPAEYVLIIEEASGVSRHELRSDIYPLERNTAA